MKKVIIGMILILGMMACSEEEPDIGISREIAFLEQDGYTVLSQVDNIGEDIMVFNVITPDGAADQVMIAWISDNTLGYVINGLETNLCQCYYTSTRDPEMFDPKYDYPYPAEGCLVFMWWDLDGLFTVKRVYCS